ncbi:hypothetical protein MCRH_1701 [Moraxella catarrhalis RH4]|nr:hypothetical protein MCRH_1701 [Moraxella catarrhalis RH4]OAV23224.1 hypothetical protein AO371_1491 [Moraxella catarrhalis]
MFCKSRVCLVLLNQQFPKLRHHGLVVGKILYGINTEVASQQ